MPTGPTWEDRYMDDPEFARQWDREMDKADEELAEYFETPKGKVMLYTIFMPIMLFVFVVVSITTPLEAFSRWVRNKKST